MDKQNTRLKCRPRPTGIHPFARHRGTCPRPKARFLWQNPGSVSQRAIYYRRRHGQYCLQPTHCPSSLQHRIDLAGVDPDEEHHHKHHGNKVQKVKTPLVGVQVSSEPFGILGKANGGARENQAAGHEYGQHVSLPEHARIQRLRGRHLADANVEPSRQD